MNRRNLLRSFAGGSVATATAGCLGTRMLGSVSSDRTTTADSNVLRTVAVSDTDPVPESVTGEFSVSLPRPTVTPERTASVRVEFTNRTETETTYVFGDYPPFTVLRSRESNPRVLLLPSDRTYEKPSPECWRPSGSSSIGVDGLAKQVTLDPDESVARTANLWGSPRNEEGVCLPTGTFRFEKQYEFESAESFVWGFALEIWAP